VDARSSPRRFGEALPDVAEGIAEDLRDSGRDELAQQVPDLPMVSLCGCHDSFCASFHTGAGNVDRTHAWGDSIVDVDAEGKIVFVEILTIDYSELRDRVRAVFGKPPEAETGIGTKAPR
jgi:hypothetical protein